MAYQGVLRPGIVQIRVLDMEKSKEFYGERVGLDFVGMTDDGRAMYKGYDEFDHHSVVLRKADEPGLDYIGFKVSDVEYLSKIEKETAAFGFQVTTIPANSDQPGFGRRIAVQTSTGHRVDLYADVEMAAHHPQIINPHIWAQEPRGMAPFRFDHALLYGPDAKTTVKWFMDILGFKLAECVKKEDGVENLAVWLTCSNKAHDLAILDFPQPGKLHHISFFLEDWQAVGHAADIMARYNISIDIGPTRHGITRGQTIYFFDPSGNRCETFAGGYFYYPDSPTRVWDSANVGEGIFYYDKVLNQRFLSVMT